MEKTSLSQAKPHHQREWEQVFHDGGREFPTKNVGSCEVGDDGDRREKKSLNKEK